MKCCHGTEGCSGAGEKHWCETTMRTKKIAKKRARPRSKKAEERARERERQSLAKARALSDRFTHVVKKHVGDAKMQQHLDSEAMLALVGAGLASFAPNARFVLEEGEEPVEFTKKEVQRAGENLITDWLLGTFKKVLPPR